MQLLNAVKLSWLLSGGLLQFLIKRAQSEDSSECGLWLGPSLIKELEEHGFGLGMFTGKTISEGETLPAELFLPIFDFDDKDHPPLREYMWNGGDYKNLVLEVQDNMMELVPGLAAIAPCTSNNFNLERLVENLEFHHEDVHRSKDASAGSFTYYHVPMFRAIRDIQPGEELTVECPDDDFDAGVHISKRYDPADEKVTCLDDKLEEKTSTLAAVGRGLFAKKNLSQDEVLLSSPAVPLHKDILTIGSVEPPGKQLLYNYCYGHPESDLLWFPYGPLLNSVNHAPPGKSPNVRVQWHQDPIKSNDELPRRQQYHHPELLDFSVERVVETHGKGLLLDLVATRPLLEGEELFLDYGKAWSDAWEAHQRKWVPQMSKYSDTKAYFHAMEFNSLYANDPIRTITEQHREPYPVNLVTACRFQEDWIEDEFAEDYDMIQYQSWDTQEEHFNCLLPCIILERIEEANEETKYTAKLVDHHHENESIDYACHIFRQFEYIYTDLPRHGIEFIEKTYTSDVFLLNAFRQAIQVSDGMYPEHWMKPKGVRRRRTTPDATPQEVEDSHTFKRKNIEPLYDKTDLQRKLQTSPRSDL